MLGVSLDQGGLKDVVPFMKDYGINYPIVLGTEEVVSAYGGIRGIPTTFVIDKNGHVRAAFEGYRQASVFEEHGSTAHGRKMKIQLKQVEGNRLFRQRRIKSLGPD